MSKTPNINASIVDQRLSGILLEHSELFPADLSSERQRSHAFVVLCISTMLD